MAGCDMSDHHQCKCNSVERCKIFTHPSDDIQDLLNQLMSKMAAWDDETGSASQLIFRSIHSAGQFESISTNELYEKLLA